MSRAEAFLRRIAGDLQDLGRRFALVGGLAVSARTEPRLTRVADLAVLVADDRDAEALVRDLQTRGWRIVAAIEQNVAGRLATVRLARTCAGRWPTCSSPRPGSNRRSWRRRTGSKQYRASRSRSRGWAISLP